MASISTLNVFRLVSGKSARRSSGAAHVGRDRSPDVTSPMRFSAFTRACLTGAIYAAAVIVGTSSPPAIAGELDKSHVPIDAKWLIHVDYEAFADSELAESIRQKMPYATDWAAEWMEKEYGIRPPKDLASITMFSRDYRRYTGTVILQADYDPQKITQKLQEEDNLRKTQWEGYTLITATLSKQRGEKGPSGDQEMTVVMVDGDTIILASSVPVAKSAIDLLKNNARSLETTDSPLLKGVSENAWMIGSAVELGNLEQHPLPMPMLSQMEQIVWSIGEENGHITEHAEFLAQSEEVAKRLYRVLDGLIAYEELWAKDSEPMQRMMKNVELDRDQDRVNLHWKGDTQTVIKATGISLQRLATWRNFLTSDRSESSKKFRR